MKLPVSYTSPRNRKRGGSTDAIRSAIAFDVPSFDGPSPTARIVGSLGSVQAPGRELAQSFRVCWKSVVFPLLSATATSTGVAAVDPACNRNVPEESRYFSVGQTNE